jgi:hypothetical protein
MAILFCRKLPKGRKQRGAYGETYEYTTEWLVRTDNPSEPLPNITNATGFGWLDPHENDPTCRALSFTTDPVGDSGMLWKVTVTYRVPPANNEDNGGGGNGSIDVIMKQPVWSGGSSVTTEPCFQYYESGNGQRRTITNSANEPLPGLEREAAEFRLQVIAYYATHSAWMADARTYTNAVNTDTWNGGMAGTWKCQGCSAKIYVENKSGVSWVGWEVTWEFAYRDDNWKLKPWDVGYSQRVGNDGTPSQAGTKRAPIKGQDGKPVRTPVALSSGVALDAGTPPEVINNGNGVRVYKEYAFGTKFGEVFTPVLPNN